LRTNFKCQNTLYFMMEGVFRRPCRFIKQNRGSITQDELVTNTLTSGPTKHTTCIYWTKRQTIFRAKSLQTIFIAESLATATFQGHCSDPREQQTVCRLTMEIHAVSFRQRNQRHKPYGKSRAVGHPLTSRRST